jgi:regulator of sirC expression with transglutaminase-like and TPR domain
VIASECEVIKVVRAGHPNVLIVGSDGGADEVIDRLRPSFSLPLHTCNLPGHLALPAEASGTLLLRHVTELAREQQDQLLDWLDRNGGNVQVISVSSTPLFSCVERGTFDTRLYYRLNTVLDQVDACCLTAT